MMTMNRAVLLSVMFSLGGLTLSGCDEPAKTQQWYKAHPEEMNKVWAKCNASGDDTPNCRNVIDAHFQVQQANAVVPDLNDLKMPDYSKHKD